MPKKVAQLFEEWLRSKNIRTRVPMEFPCWRTEDMIEFAEYVKGRK